MLVDIRIETFQLLTNTHLQVRKCFTVITGNSGSGKSMLIQAIKFIAGLKTQTPARELAGHAHVTCTLSQNAWPDIESTLHTTKIKNIKRQSHPKLSRRIDEKGKQHITLNDAVITIKQLQAIMEPWLFVHDQHAHLGLTKSETLLKLLDAYSEHPDALATLHNDYQTLTRHQQHAQNIGKELCDLGCVDSMQQMLDDANTHQLQSLQWDQLEIEQKRLQQTADFIHSCEASHQVLTQQSPDPLTTIYQRIQSLSRYEKTFSELTPIVQMLTESHTLLEEACHNLQDIVHNQDDWSEKQAKKASLDEKISTMHEFCRKYSLKPHEIAAGIQVAESAVQKHHSLTQAKTRTDAEVEACHQAFVALAADMHARRRDKADTLSSALSAVLHTLSMPGAKAILDVEWRPDTISASGMNRITCLFRASPSQTMAPAAKTASGGEMARIMLALETLLPTNTPKLMIFDEADVGVSGQQALQIGQLLQKLGSNHSVFCITHSAQVAACGHDHVFLEKKQKEAGAYSTANLLNPNQHIQEVARLLGGNDVHQAAIDNAKSLCEEAHGQQKMEVCL